MYPSGRTFLPQFLLCMRQKDMIEDWMVEMSFKMPSCTTYIHTWSGQTSPRTDHDERNRTMEILLGKYLLHKY